MPESRRSARSGGCGEGRLTLTSAPATTSISGLRTGADRCDARKAPDFRHADNDDEYEIYLNNEDDVDVEDGEELRAGTVHLTTNVYSPCAALAIAFQVPHLQMAIAGVMDGEACSSLSDPSQDEE